MMLLYKAWLESRTRFGLSVIAIAALIALFVLMNRDVRADVADLNATYSQYLWSAIYKGYLRDIFVVVVLLLGMGGIARERAYGTSGFTLTLPVGRWRLTATRAAVGLAESTIIAFLPAILLPLLSPLVNETYPWSQALHFAVLWVFGGSFVFTIGFLVSALFTGEYSAPIAAVALLFAYSIVTDLPRVESYVIDIHDFMKGTGPQGPPALAAVSASSIMLIAVAGYITRRKDF
jgi:ABC-type transport system involved in multi-copper enzyme maturation permease subunit